MKIGVVGDTNIPSRYAHSISVMKMADAFASLGHDVVVYTADSLLSRWRSLTLASIRLHYGLRHDIEIKFIKPSIHAFVTGRTQDDWPFAKSAVTRLLADNVDAVYCRSYRVPVLATKWEIPTIVETHTTNFQKLPLRELVAVSDRPSLRLLVTIHESIAREHVENGVPVSKLVVEEDGVDLCRFQAPGNSRRIRSKLQVGEEQFLCVYCGHLLEEKGLNVIIDVAGLLQASDADFVLALIGGHPWDVIRCRLSAFLSRVRNLRLTGFVNNSEVPDYLMAADCLLLPYDPSVTDGVMDLRTTSPLKLFEYLASGTPIVATGIQRISELLTDGETALLAEPGSAEDFADKICKVRTTPKLAESLGRSAREFSKQFAWCRRAARILRDADLT